MTIIIVFDATLPAMCKSAIEAQKNTLYFTPIPLLSQFNFPISLFNRVFITLLESNLKIYWQKFFKFKIGRK
jgi:hypothetical protein